jgi:hypothetical protein
LLFFAHPTALFKPLCFFFAWMPVGGGDGLHWRGGGLSRAGMEGPGLRRGLPGSCFPGESKSKSKSKPKSDPSWTSKSKSKPKSDPNWTSKSKSKPQVRSELDFEVQVQPKVRHKIGLGLQVQVQFPGWTSKSKSKQIGLRALPCSEVAMAVSIEQAVGLQSPSPSILDFVRSLGGW